MTEQEWLASTDPTPMLGFLREKARVRKLRLFACACVSRCMLLLPSENSAYILEAAERFADGGGSEKELETAQSFAIASIRHYPVACGEASQALWRLTKRQLMTLARPVAFLAAVAMSLQADEGGIERPNECSVQANLLRDIFGPLLFRPVTIYRMWLAWNDGVIPKLGQSIYDDRAFDRLPVLADALEDAGCSNADILAHCRQPGPHVRGCWAADLILGKE